VGKSVDFIQAALKSLHITDNVLRWTITASKLNQAFYLIFDHLVLAGRIGLAKVIALKLCMMHVQKHFSWKKTVKSALTVICLSMVICLMGPVVFWPPKADER
jgi:hypothetical protein